jgi:hypothetical protein
VLLAAQVHVLDHVEVVAQGEVLVHDLDSQPGRVLRAVDVHGFPLEEDLAAVRGVDAGHALDQGRFARAVVTDERHDLSLAHLEVDVGERLYRPERLRDAAELEDRRLVHDVEFPSTKPVEAPAWAPPPVGLI